MATLRTTGTGKINATESEIITATCKKTDANSNCIN